MKLPAVCNLPTINEEEEFFSGRRTASMSTKIVRQKLNSSKRRLEEKADGIDEAMNLRHPTKYQAARHLMELEKKIRVFEKHFEELAHVSKDDEAELERFLKDYDMLDEILNNAHELQSKLQYIVKYQEAGPPGAEDGSGGSSNVCDTLEKLKLNVAKFDGNILNWGEFWDRYELMIHNNPRLQTADKFAYLKRHVEGKAKHSLSDIDTSTENYYELAVDTLVKKYGNTESLIYAHYEELHKMPQSPEGIAELSTTMDRIEKHLLALMALGEEVDGNTILSLVQSKLPDSVLRKLGEYRNDQQPWDLKTLKKCLKKFLAAEEAIERQLSSKEEPKRPPPAPPPVPVKGRSCMYCSGQHWNDECDEYKDVASRKKRLPGHCYLCLQRGHLKRHCYVRKECVYCTARSDHHRSLCPKQFTHVPPIKNEQPEPQTSQQQQQQQPNHSQPQQRTDGQHQPPKQSSQLQRLQQKVQQQKELREKLLRRRPLSQHLEEQQQQREQQEQEQQQQEKHQEWEKRQKLQQDKDEQEKELQEQQRRQREREKQVQLKQQEQQRQEQQQIQDLLLKQLQQQEEERRRRRQQEDELQTEDEYERDARKAPPLLADKSNRKSSSLAVPEGFNGRFEDRVMMQTALVRLINTGDPLNRDKYQHKARLLLDCGSQRTYISQYMADKLRLKEVGKNFLVVHTFGTSKPENIEARVVEFGIRLRNGTMKQLKANVVPSITGKIQRQPVEYNVRRELGSYDLADTVPETLESLYVDLLVGNDYYAELVSVQRTTLSNGLYLVESKLGWILSGRTQPGIGDAKFDDHDGVSAYQKS